MDKEDVEYIYNGILFSCKKEGNPAILKAWMELEGIMLREVRQRKTKLHGITYMWNKKKSQTHKNRVEK